MRTLRPAVVLRPTADGCALADGTTAAWSVPFAPRADRVSPGQLVAVTADGPPLVLWRWYDGVVVGTEDGRVRLWEPAHGEVLARPRRPGPFAPGSRAWLSAGLPGADWWVAGPVTGADVELAEVAAFYDEHGLWDRLR